MEAATRVVPRLGIIVPKSILMLVWGFFYTGKPKSERKLIFKY